MGYRPGTCLLPEIMRERKIEPIKVYTDPRINMTKQQFSNYYTGRTKMSSGTLKTFAEYFGLPMDDFYTWDWHDESPRKRSRHESE